MKNSHYALHNGTMVDERFRVELLRIVHHGGLNCVLYIAPIVTEYKTDSIHDAIAVYSPTESGVIHLATIVDEDDCCWVAWEDAYSEKDFAFIFELVTSAGYGGDKSCCDLRDWFRTLFRTYVQN